LHLDLAKFVPFIQPFHGLQSLLAIYDLCSLLRIEQSGVEDVLIDLGPDAAHVLVLTGDESVASNVVHADGARERRRGCRSKVAVLCLAAWAGPRALTLRRLSSSAALVVATTKGVHINHLIESKILLRMG